MLRGIAAFAVTLAAGAILAVAAFRPPDVVLYHPAPEPALARVEGDPTSFTLRFVELDDDGHFADGSQVQALLDDLRAQMPQTDTTVLLYVHGWNHNAAADNENVACFKQLVRGAALMQSKLRSANGAPRAVFAIYVGWPGLVYENRAVNKALTFFGREATADRIGERGDLLQLLIQVSRLRNEHDGAKFVIVAHSLGARLTYKALRPVMQSAVDRAAGRQGQLADVTVLVNPALAAEDHVSLSRLMNTASDGARQVPRFIVATSRADGVLSGLFSGARRLVSFVRGDFRLGPTSRTVAMGLYRDYVTHLLELVERVPGAYVNVEGADGCPTLDYRELSIADDGRRALKPAELYTYDRIAHYGDGGEAQYETRLTSVPGRPSSPIMVVTVSGDIIPNHNDIWTSPFVDFVSRVINASLYGPSD